MAIFSKLKQYKELRDQAKEMQTTLAKESVYADTAGGKIQVMMDGNQAVNGVSVDPEYLAPNRKTELEKALKDAFNSAIKKSQMAMAKKAKEMGKLDLPGQ
jgi:DNA-binding protein YbaB